MGKTQQTMSQKEKKMTQQEKVWKDFVRYIIRTIEIYNTNNGEKTMCINTKEGQIVKLK